MRHILLALAIVPTTLHFAELITCIREPDPVDQTQVKCLAVMIYGEARGESAEGKAAVAHSALNRAKSKTICEVVLAPKQYSVFNNNPTLRAAALSSIIEPAQKNSIDADSWAQSARIAALVLQGKIADPTRGATHYIADHVMKLKGYRYPRWSKVYTQAAVIDNHRFFKYSSNR